MNIWQLCATQFVIWGTLGAEACDFGSLWLVSWPLRLGQVTRPLKVKLLCPQSNNLLSKGPYSLIFSLCIILYTLVPTVPTELEEQAWLREWTKHHCMSTPRAMNSVHWRRVFLLGRLEPRTLRKEPHLLQANILEGKLYNSPPLLFVQIASNSKHCHNRKQTTNEIGHFPFTLPLSPKHSFFHPYLKRPNQSYS